MKISSRSKIVRSSNIIESSCNKELKYDGSLNMRGELIYNRKLEYEVLKDRIEILSRYDQLNKDLVEVA